MKLLVNFYCPRAFDKRKSLKKFKPGCDAHGSCEGSCIWIEQTYSSLYGNDSEKWIFPDIIEAFTQKGLTIK